MKIFIKLFLWVLGISFFVSCTDDMIAPPLQAPELETPDIGDRAELKELHVDGRYLKDDEGNIVNLHGVAQTFSPFFNNNAWTNYDVDGCLRYNKNLLDEVLAAGWEINFVRQHMDPYWSSPGAPSEAEAYAYYDEERFKKYLDIVFVPMAEFAISRGCYVVMRPPGVSPHEISVGDDYQNYLVAVWDIVSQHPRLKDNPYVMFELANEPVNIRGKDGSSLSDDEGFKQLTEYFQKVVDTVRKNCSNIIWVPGLGYQSQYAGYAKNRYPIKDELNNFGFAIHVYPGWYGSDGENEDGGVGTGGGYVAFQNGWDNQVGPVASDYPIMVTEMDWAPAKYDSSWGKALTGEAGGSGFGANFKLIVDNSGNVSWLIFTGMHLMADFVDEPGIPGQYNFLNDPEACPWPVYHWWQEYAGVTSEDYGTLTDVIIEGYEKGEDGKYHLTLSTGNNFYLVVKGKYDSGKTKVLTGVKYSSSTPDVVSISETGKINALKDGTATITVTYEEWNLELEIDVTMFPLTSSVFNPSIWETGSFDEKNKTLITGQYGFGGWEYNNGIDLSQFKYLVAELDNEDNSLDGKTVNFRLFDQGYWNGAADYKYNFSANSKAVADVQNMYKDNNGVKTRLDPSSIKIVGFWSPGGFPIKIKSVYTTNEWPFADVTGLAVTWPASVAIGGESLMAVTATFSDGSTRDVTYEVDYNTTSASIISVDKKGYLKGVAEGTATITVSFGPEGNKKEVQKEITVTGSAKSLSATNLPLQILSGKEVSYMVYAHFGDGSTLEFTNAVEYVSSNTSVLEVTDKGKIKAISAGKSTLIISYMSTQLKKDIEVVSSAGNFDMVGGWFNPQITGTSEYDYETGLLKMTNSGLIGWEYGTAVNLRADSNKKYLVAQLSADSGDCWFVLGNGGAYNPCYVTSAQDMVTVGDSRYIVVDVTKDYTENGYNHGDETIYLDQIKLLALQSYGSTITIKKIYLSDTDPTAGGATE